MIVWRSTYWSQGLQQYSKMWILTLFLLSCLTLTFADRPEDEVTFLPGLDVQPTFKHWAGYLNATNDRRLWYWLVESENDPANDPVVLWLNGGPGCSSMTGKLTEIGPWRSHSNGSLTWFDYRWNKFANLIFFDAPQCVGFSYTENYEDVDYCRTGDDETALDNHMALKDFFAGFPEFASNEFYITGESYAGVYVPTLSARVVDDPEINFQGMAIGNGVNDNSIQDSGLVEYLWARGTFGSDLYEDLVNGCCPGGNATYCKYADNNDPSCTIPMMAVNNIAWNIGLNPYAIYDQCFPNAPNMTTWVVWETEDEVMVAIPDGIPMKKEQWSAFQENLDNLRATGKTIYGGIPCTDTSNRANYLNRPDVREALHVPSFVPEWEACSDLLRYTREYDDVRNEYMKVLNAGHRVVVFFGDTDIACNHHGGMWFIESLHLPEESGYQQWLYDAQDGSQQLAGFVKEWTGLKFVTVKGSGHMVPTDTPKRGYIIFDKFLKDESYTS